MASISGMEMSVSVKEKKPSVSAALTSSDVISSILSSKFANEMRGIERVLYLVAPMSNVGVGVLVRFRCTAWVTLLTLLSLGRSFVAL